MKQSRTVWTVALLLGFAFAGPWRRRTSPARLQPPNFSQKIASWWET